MMAGILRIGMIVVAGSMMLPLGACSRTSDGTVVMDNPVALPSLNLKVPKPQLPSWMKRKEPEPVVVAQNFPPPPAKKVVHRRKTRPPVVTTGSGNLACKNVSEGGRVRMVCE
jgi:riboflavin biosynthesis pyrimidine reductase